MESAIINSPTTTAITIAETAGFVTIPSGSAKIRTAIYLPDKGLVCVLGNWLTSSGSTSALSTSMSDSGKICSANFVSTRGNGQFLHNGSYSNYTQFTPDLPN